MADISVGSEQVETTGTDSPKSKVLVLLNLFLAAILYGAVYWLNDNIYRYDPWYIGPEWVDNTVNWFSGFFFLSVFEALRRGKMQALQQPSRFLDKNLFKLLSRRSTAVGLGFIGVGVFVYILLHPAVHLDYAAGGEKPMVILNGNPQHFNDTTIFLAFDPTELLNKKIEVTDPRDLYRIKLAPSDASSNTILFSKHARINLQKFFIHRDFRAELSDANNRNLGSFAFSYESTESLSKTMCRF